MTMTTWTHDVFELLALATRDAAVLILLIAGILALVGRRIPASWRHALWLLVALRLAVPVLPVSSLSWQTLLPVREKTIPTVAAELNSPQPRQIPSQEVQPPISPIGTEQATEPEAPSTRSSEFATSPAPRSPEFALPAPASLKIGALIAWLIGVAACSLLALSATLAFARRRRLLKVTDHPRMADLSAQLTALAGNSRVTLEISDAVRTPALHGLLRPVILLPPSAVDSLDHAQMAYVLRHELAHHARRDGWTQWALALLQALFWFHPLVWWAFRRTRIEAEHATDELVLSAVGADDAQAYGETLLRLLDGRKQPPKFSTLPGLIGVVEKRRDLRARMKAIGGYRERRTRARLANALAIVLFCAVAAVGLTQAPDNTQSKTEDVKPTTDNKNAAWTPGDSYPLHVNVLITDQDGQPVDGAEVIVTAGTDTRLRLHSPIMYHGKTDAEGRIDTEGAMVPGYNKWGYWFVVARKPDKGATFSWLANDPSELRDGKRPVFSELPMTTLKLEPVGDLPLRVLSPDGKPLAGLELSVNTISKSLTLDNGAFFPMWLQNLPPLPSNLWRATTNESGLCVIRELPLNARVVLDHDDDRWATFPGRRDFSMGMTSGEDTETVTLSKAASIGGRVTDAQGIGVGNVEMWALEPRPLVTAHLAKVFTDEQGRYRIPNLPAANYQLSARLPSDYSEQPWIPSTGDNVRVKPGEHVEGQDFQLVMGAEIIGQLVDAETQSLVGKPEKWIVAPGKTQFHYSGWTPSEYHPNQEQYNVKVAEGETKTVEFEVHKIQTAEVIRGVVVDSAGKPVADALVKPFPTANGDGDVVSCLNDGSFEIKLAPGRTTTRLLARDGQRYSDGTLEYSGGEKMVRVVIGLEPPIRASGRVLDMSGQPIAGAKVTWDAMKFPDERERKVVTDEDGRFELTGYFERDTVTWWVGAEGYGSTEGTEPLAREPGEITELPDLKIPPADSRIAGQVTDSSGNPVPSARIQVDGHLQPQPDLRVYSDAEGKFEVKGVVDTWLWVEATQYVRDSWLRNKSRVRAGDENIVVRMPVPETMPEWQPEKKIDFIGKPAPRLHAVHWIHGAGINNNHAASGKVRVLCLVGIDRSLLFHLDTLRWMQKMRLDFPDEDAVEFIAVHGPWPLAEIEEVLAKEIPDYNLPLVVESEQSPMSTAFGERTWLTVVIDQQGIVRYQGSRGKDAKATIEALLAK